MLSVLIFPMAALALRRRTAESGAIPATQPTPP
jgi:hypothetical protein